MRHLHGHEHTMRHPDALGHHVRVVHDHEHRHQAGVAPHGGFRTQHRMHAHTAAEMAELRRQQRGGRA